MREPAETAPPQQQPILLPKLRVPRPHSTLVPRERLFARLDEGLQGKLTLVVAPAGFGKTSLVSHWLAVRQQREDFPLAAWVSLEGGDNEPLRFWRYVVAACQALRGGIGQVLLDELSTESPARPHAGPSEEALAVFLNELTHLPREGLLVLEDYHVIANEQVHRSLAFLLDHMPEPLRIVIMSRGEPPLPLARMRALGELHEIGMEDLRFSQDEALSFLESAAAVSLAPDEAAQLEAHIEGWAAGLRLVALALKGRVVRTRKATEEVLASFTGGHRHPLEYFVSEVLDAPSEPVQLFLLQTSILPRLTGSLCDAVTERHDSARMLEALERAGFFLVRLDEEGQWYRYHALFAEAMQQEARSRLGDEAMKACHLRASLWYEQNGAVGEAIEAALNAADHVRGPALIERLATARQLTERHEVFTMQRWLDQLPERVLHDSPALSFLAAETLVFSSDSNRLPPAIEARVEGLLQRAEEGWRRASDNARLGEVLAFQALLAARREQIAVAAALARKSLEVLPQTEQFQASRAINLGIVGEWERQAGHFAPARQHLTDALRISEETDHAPAIRVLALGLANVCFESGELHKAARLYRRALEEAGDDPTDKAGALLGLARVSYEWNDLAAAHRHAIAALELSMRLADEALRTRSEMVLAQVLHALGHEGEAQRLLEEISSRLERATPSLPLLELESRTLRERLRAMSGDYPGAAYRLTTSGPEDGEIPELLQAKGALVRARHLLAAGDADAATKLLSSWRGQGPAEGQSLVGLEMRALASLALAQAGQAQEALHELEGAVSLGANEGNVRVYVDAGRELEDLLRSLLRESQNGAALSYVPALLRAFGGKAREHTPEDGPAPSTSGTAFEPLSDQEQRVLRLFVAGMSREEVARELVISVNTVKTHLKHIYRKLNATSRAEAQEAARALHLL